MTRWLALAALPLAAAASVPATAQNEGIMGRWWTQDHDGVIELRPCGTGVCGFVVGVTTFRPDGSAPIDYLGHSRCHLQIVPGGLQGNDGVWASHITNPDNGKTYTTQMSLDDRGRLRLRGYIGLPLFGQTVFWTRFNGRLAPDCHID